MQSPVAALAYAIYDAESTGRLGEDPDAQAEYFARARQLLFTIKHYQTRAARLAIAREIKKSK